MGLNFLLYRGARFLAGEQSACPCLGSAADWLGLRPAVVDAALLGFSAFLLVGSGVLLWGARPLAFSPALAWPGRR